jgi:hypothetical protein
MKEFAIGLAECFGLITLILILLRLFGAIGVSWFLVFIPVLIPMTLLSAFLVGSVIFHVSIRLFR